MKRAARSIEDAVNLALGDACVEVGFCSMPMAQRVELAQRTRLTATEFAKAVIAGEGMHPDYDTQHQKALERCFISRAGRAVLNASDFTPDSPDTAAPSLRSRRGRPC